MTVLRSAMGMLYLISEGLSAIFFCLPSQAAVLDRTANQMTNQRRIRIQDLIQHRVIVKNRINLALLGIRKTILILMIAAVK